MFRSLINDAKSAAGAVIGRYAIRASVGIPFVVATGFATAAGTLLLVERFGAVTAYAIMAGAFAGVGLLAALAVTVKEQEEVVADTQAEKTDTANVATDAAAQAAVQLPLALLGTLLTTPLGPGVAAGGARMLARNLPLVILVGLIALLFWPSSSTTAETATAGADASKPETEDRDWQPPVSNGVDRHATPA